MATYFAAKSPDTGRRKTFAQADRLADAMIRKLTALDVRLIAVRSLGSDGFVFAVASRRSLQPQAVTSVLRNDPGLGGYRISAETPTIEGPFQWKKEGRSALERPSLQHSDAVQRGG